MAKIIGLDIGGTKIRAVLWNGEKVLQAKEIKTPKNLTAFKREILKLISNLEKSSPTSTSFIRIGIGIAGVVAGNNVFFCPNIKYLKKFDFQELLSNRIAKLDNDARCFARAELADGAIGRKNAFFLMLGTGVGRAVAKNGKVLKIKKFEYPEGWEARYQKVRDKKDNKALADFLVEKLTALINQYFPDAIIVGGGVANRKNFIATFRHSAECWNVGAKIIKSRLGKNSVAIGAAMFF